MSLNNREFLIWKKREREREKERERERERKRERDREREREGERGWAGQQAGIFFVRLGLGEIEGRDRDTER